MTTEATIVLEFNGGSSSDADYIAVVELDDVSNNDKTTFHNGDEPVLRAHFSENIRVDAVVSTAGEMIYDGTATRTLEHTQLFSSRDSDDPTTYTFPVVPISTGVDYNGRIGSYTTETGDGGIITATSSTVYTPFRANFTSTYKVRLDRLVPNTIIFDSDTTYTIDVVYYLTLLKD